MKTTFRVSALTSLLLIATLIAGCAVTGQPNAIIRGSGVIITESRAVTGFTQILLAGSGNVIIEQGGEESLTIETDDNIMPLLITQVAGGRLTLSSRPNTSFSYTRLVYRITLRDLTAVEIAGSGTVEAAELETPAITITIAGSGNVTLRGTAPTQTVSIPGSGIFDGTNLVGREGTVTIAGSGSAIMNVSDSLNASILGSGTVEYLGSPTVAQNIAGAGAVRPR